jgi:hypothetical protein
MVTAVAAAVADASGTARAASSRNIAKSLQSETAGNVDAIRA